ncbi:IgGFc-binding protein-like [Ostrea edulis]|uniref:IgGFc-binding protein-like n=1 Tax=Ostrea edulis TaxID=37623 RepID=UPI0024AED0CA|nr:IgGFc-binding protein-like [Ostrea edulis]
MALIKSNPYLVLVSLLFVFMADIYSGQTIDFVKDTWITSPGIESLRKELRVLSQAVKNQALRINILEGELTDVKQKKCQCESLVFSPESYPTTKMTLTTTKAMVTSSTLTSTTLKDSTIELPALKGNAGREFLVLFMRNHPGSTGALSLYVTTENETILNVSSAQDLKPAIKSKIDRKTTVTSELNFTLPFDLTCKYLTVEPKAVLLQTSELSTVTAFDSLYEGATDGSLIIPTSKLSTKYLISTTEPYKINRDFYSQFAIGALFDGSNINVTFKMKKEVPLSLPDGSYTDGDVCSIALGRLETFQVRHTTDLTGTLITSSKPIAVFSGHRCQALKSKYCSHMVTQLPPTNELDKDYIVPTFYNNEATLIQVVSEHTSTVILTVGDRQSTWYLNERDFKNVEVKSGEITVIVSDQPVLVSGFGMGVPYDSYMTVIPGVHQYLDFYKITVPAGYTENYICVIIPMDYKTNLRINGLRVNQYKVVYESSKVLNTTTYVIYTFEVEAGTFLLSTSDHSAFGLIVYGHRNIDGYSFAGNILLP